IEQNELNIMKYIIACKQYCNKTDYRAHLHQHP
ncbi:hypothetical protein Y032_1216g3762, partial [Ancylostoma ceylanicum]